MLIFEWDAAKASSNEAKHGVTFDEAKTVFNDLFSLTIPDFYHSQVERRWLDIGFSFRGRLLVVWYTEKEGVIRIIGARAATKSEQSTYSNERAKKQ